MTPNTNRRRAARIAGLLALVAGCSGDDAAGALPLPPEGSELDPRLAARVEEAADAVRASPEDVAPWLELGMLYEANELYGLAADCYGRALAVAPSAKAWHRLGCAEASRGDARAAADALKRSIELDPAYAPSHWRLGSALFELGEFDAALAAFQEVTRRDPEHLGGPLGVARVHLQRGEPARAIEILERARAGRPDDRTVSRLLHGAYLQVGRAADAARIDVSPRGRPPTYGKDPWQREMRERWERPRMEQALELLQSGGAAEAVALLERFVDEAPDDLNARAYLAQAFLASARPDEARRVCDEALALEPDNLLVLGTLARVHEASGDVDAALATLGRIVEVDPRDAQSWRRKGRVETGAGRREDALASLSRAFELDRREPEVLVEIGALELGLGRDADAIASFERARAAGVERPDLVLGLARAYARAGRSADAIALVEATPGLGRAGEALLGELRAQEGAPK